MPEISLIDVPLYDSLDIYHFEADNLPLRNLLRISNLINNQVDYNSSILRESVGSSGSLSARLNVSLNPDGSLVSSEIDSAFHSIEAHSETAAYVLFSRANRDKLALIANEATNVYLSTVLEDLTEVNFTSGKVAFLPSESIVWTVDNTNEVRGHVAFPLTALHMHQKDQTPIDLDTNFINYKVNALSTPYIEGSLEVFINGMRLSATASQYITGSMVDSPWSLLSFTPNHLTGTFTLSNAITDDDVIRINYELPFA